MRRNANIHNYKNRVNVLKVSDEDHERQEKDLVKRRHVRIMLLLPFGYYMYLMLTDEVVIVGCSPCCTSDRKVKVLQTECT